MARAEPPSTSAPATPTPVTPTALSALRAQAQRHLQEIAHEDAAEQISRQTRAQDLQKYARARKSPRPPWATVTGQDSTVRKAATSASAAAASSSSSSSSSGSKHGALRTAQEALDRIRHDPALRAAEYSVGYLERFDGIVERAATAWTRDSTAEDFVPQHRIKWIKRRRGDEEEVVWSREGKVDLICGSGRESGKADTRGSTGT